MPLVGLRLRGGGGDGGVYPLTHAEQQWMTPSGMGTTGKAWSNHTKDRASEGTLRLDRATLCAATSKPLHPPIVVDELGYLLNKEDVLQQLLSKALPPHLSHIRSLRSLHDATLHPNTAYSAGAGHVAGRSDDDDEPPFCCPIASLPLNGRYPFVYVRPTGHIVSLRALKQVGGKMCPVTETPLGSDDDTIPINPSDEERQEREKALAARKAESKRKAKEGKAELRAPPARASDGAGASVGWSAREGAGAAAAVGHGPTTVGGTSEASTGAAGKAKAAGRGSESMPPPPTAAAAVAPGIASKGSGKRPRAEWEEAVADKASTSQVYKSLFLSKEERKRQEAQEAANFCARGIVPSINRSKFGLG